MKRFAPAAARNREPIAQVLAEELPQTGLVLELASGTGEHAVYFAQRFSTLIWQPSDSDSAARASIAAWREDVALKNLLPPLELDAAASEWPVDAADALLCINMVHISPGPRLRGCSPERQETAAARRAAGTLWPVPGGCGRNRAFQPRV
jgi:hypothetical protein